jgi:hypothetical protein
VHDRDPACGNPFQVLFQVLIEASLAAAGGVRAADEYPVVCAQEVGYLFQGAPGQRRPCFLLAEQEDKRVGGVAGDGEPAPARWVARTSPGAVAARTAFPALPATL